MVLENPNVIDMVLRSFPSEDCSTVYVIVDGTRSMDPEQRLELLLRKLKVYAFAITQLPPSERDVWIKVICTESPTEAMKEITGVRGEGPDGPLTPVFFLSRDEALEPLKGQTGKRRGCLTVLVLAAAVVLLLLHIWSSAGHQT